MSEDTWKVKILKMEIYVIERNGFIQIYGIEAVKEELDGSYDLSVEFGDIEEKELDWNDNHILNQKNTSIEEYRKVFEDK